MISKEEARAALKVLQDGQHGPYSAAIDHTAEVEALRLLGRYIDQCPPRSGADIDRAIRETMLANPRMSAPEIAAHLGIAESWVTRR